MAERGRGMWRMMQRDYQHQLDEDGLSVTTASSLSQREIIDGTEVHLARLNEESDFVRHVLRRPDGVGGRIFRYRKRKSRIDNGDTFTAPDGVSPHHVTSSIIRRNAGDSRLVFIWPQNAHTRGKLLSILAPLMHGILIGLLCLDAVHLWPGEFLPVSLPSTTPVPLPPIKCNVIEPRWFDNM